MIKYGIKIWSTDTSLFEQIDNSFKNKELDYVEIYAVPNSLKYVTRRWKDLKTPAIVHAPTIKHGVNICNKVKYEENKHKLNEAFEFADTLKSGTVIIHPGFDGEIETGIKLLTELNDSRITIENVPQKTITGKRFTGVTPEELKQYLINDFKMCLDFGHATKAAISLGLDYKDLIIDYINYFNPTQFHICDGTLKEEDDHLQFGKGQFDLVFFMECLVEQKNDIKVTIETPRLVQSSIYQDLIDVDFMRRMTK